MTVRIVTDSTADLMPEEAAALGVTVVPLNVYFGDETLRDGVDIDPTTFYERLATAKELPRTSQPSVERFKAAYEELAKETNEIVSIHLSSRLSGTMNSASVAREEVSHELHIELIDTYTVSLALGAIVTDAAVAANAGASMAEVIDVARRAMDRVRVAIVVDTLEYLQRGGRIGRAQSLLGSVLSIKPIIHVEDGEVAPLERVRTRSRAVERIFEMATADKTLRRLVIACTADDEQALALIERIRPVMPHTDVRLGRLGSVVGVYVGPNALGCAMVRRE
ncbi:MAG TPA: DegV family protein [Tepidiformaceae bacterium]|jgi:DegV family protein with EDD domain